MRTLLYDAQVRLLERIRMNAASVQPASLTSATPADIERMDNKCAVSLLALPLDRCHIVSEDVWSSRKVANH